MEYLIGIALAVGVCFFAIVTGFDRDRVFYPSVLLVVASYYILFAVMAGSTVLTELLAASLFVILAVAGFRRSLWVVVVGLAGHGVFDFFHHLLIRNPGVPPWWPGFCLGFDVLAAGFLATLLIRRSGFAAGVPGS